MQVDVFSEKVELLPGKALWLRDQKIVLIADLHLGKVNHFRRSGIPVPQKANDKNTEMLISILQQTNPNRLIFLGDLFHSHYNEEWEVLGQIRKHYKACSFELVVGNHDILSKVQYERHDLIMHNDELVINNFKLTHEPLIDVPDGFYNLCGHIHPAVTLRGTGRQSVTLPCFYFTKNQGILPAFGSFTGTARIVPAKEDRIYAIANNRIFDYTNA